MSETGDKTETIVLTGHLDPGAPDLVYLPVEVPAGVCRIAASYRYDRPEVPDGVPGNACDLGVFDAAGTGFGGAGFRGWSGGARDSFSIGASSATPGYLPGEVGAGTWHIALGPYTVAPQGMDYRVEVTLTFGAPEPALAPASYPPLSATGRGRSWYRGDCHLHTVYSDGGRGPDEVAAAARAAGLDFITSTEHNTPSAHRVWAQHAGDDLLVLLGEEVTTRNGHWIAAGIDGGTFIDWRFRARDGVLAEITGRVRDAGGLCVAAHPYGPCVACSFKFGFGEFDAVEVWNGAWTPDDEAATAAWDGRLADGERHWLPAMGNSDSHQPDQQIGLPQTVVAANGLNRADLTAGIRAGHSWIADAATVELDLVAVGAHGQQAGLGERLDVAADEPVSVRLTCSGVPQGTVRIITDEGEVYRRLLPADGTGQVEWRTSAAASTYLRVEVRRPNGAGWSLDPRYGPMAALTNPIFLGGR